mmetsp:Transcript_12908/g.22650  ORF Transcript_12908/g.22650 Transcript_12908/m.22650 type:complete len:464 (-) Transcript_12908:90-1481(-)
MADHHRRTQHLSSPCRTHHRRWRQRVAVGIIPVIHLGRIVVVIFVVPRHSQRDGRIINVFGVRQRLLGRWDVIGVVYGIRGVHNIRREILIVHVELRRVVVHAVHLELAAVWLQMVQIAARVGVCGRVALQLDFLLAVHFVGDNALTISCLRVRHKLVMLVFVVKQIAVPLAARKSQQPRLDKNAKQVRHDRADDVIIRKASQDWILGVREASGGDQCQSQRAQQGFEHVALRLEESRGEEPGVDVHLHGALFFLAFVVNVPVGHIRREQVDGETHQERQQRDQSDHIAQIDHRADPIHSDEDRDGIDREQTQQPKDRHANVKPREQQQQASEADEEDPCLEFHLFGDVLSQQRVGELHGAHHHADVTLLGVFARILGEDRLPAVAKLFAVRHVIVERRHIRATGEVRTHPHWLDGLFLLGLVVIQTNQLRRGGNSGAPDEQRVAHGHGDGISGVASDLLVLL